MEYKSNRIKDVESYIELELIVYRGAKCVHRKRFKNKYKYPKQVKVIDDISLSYSPMQMMGITLSLNTRDIVEEIVQEINLIIESNLQVLKQP